jgi:hypothetical protein
MWAEKSPHPKSPRRVRRAERVMMHVKLLPSFTSLQLLLSGRRNWVVPILINEWVCRDFKCSVWGPTFINCQVLTQVCCFLLSLLFWFVSFKKKTRETNKSGFFRWSPNCQIALVCLALCEEALKSEVWTLCFLRESALLTSLLGGGGLDSLTLDFSPHYLDTGKDTVIECPAWSECSSSSSSRGLAHADRVGN